MSEARFSGWRPVGAISIGPADESVDVALVELADGQVDLWVRIWQRSTDPVPYSYGLLTWVSANGRELGTRKVYGHAEGETYRLGEGLPPVERRGVLRFEPRPYNLRWITASTQPWQLSFQVWQPPLVTALAGDGGQPPGHVRHRTA